MSVAPAYKTALLAYSLGLRVAPPKQDGSKAPNVTGWKAATSERPDEDQLDRWYVNEGHSGVGLVCGAASKNLEVLDFDAVESYEAFVSMARALEWGDLVDRIEDGYLERSPGGVHWLYYCSEIGGNTKLASRPKRPDEMRHPRDTVKTLIETRAEGGYIIIAPTNGSVHETGRPYVLERGSLRTITTLTPDERHDLLGLARTFDQMPDTDPKASYEATRPGAGGARPGDDFISRVTWDDVLTPHGWKRLYGSGNEQYWRRPGKDRGQSATTNYRGSDLLYVFSSSTEFEPERGYNKFNAYAILTHGGDWKAAASALRLRGYGKQAGATVGRIGLSGTATGGAVSSPGRPLTETGNAERLADQYGDQIRFCHPWGAWMRWDGRRWKRDQTGAVRRLGKAVVRGIMEEASRAETKDERDTLLRWARRSESSAARAAMLKLAEAEDGVPILPEDMDRDPYLLNVLNGTIDLRTGELKPHDRDASITKLAPVVFDPEAKCPLFMTFLQRVLPDPEVGRFLRRMAGYGLTGVTIEQCLAFLFGSGANGKSTFLGVMQELLGDYAQQAAPELLVSRGGDRHPTELADLFGARWVSSIEVDEGKRLAETLVKQMTGGDKMKARFMRTDFFQWTPTHKLFIAANHKPEIIGTDDAIWRRIHLIPFDVTIPSSERDPHLAEKLALELPGILRWAIAGCLEWQRNGLGVPTAVQAATDEYRQEQDTFGVFLEERCVVDPQAWIASNGLYAAYSGWCDASGTYREEPQKFGRLLSERGFVRAKGTGGVRLWRGLRLCDAPRMAL